MAADLLSTVPSELDARLDELRPVLSEYERLLAAAAALDAGNGGSTRPKLFEFAFQNRTQDTTTSGVVPAPRFSGTGR